LCLLFACLAGVSWFGLQITPSSVYDHRFHDASFILFPLMCVLTPLAFWRLIAPLGPPIRMDGEGITDLRAGAEKVLWSDILNVVQRGEYVILTLSRKRAKTYPFSWSQRLLKTTRKSAGPSHLLIALWCLKTTRSTLFEQIETHRGAS
jgi:hypothetical protein